MAIPAVRQPLTEGLGNLAGALLLAPRLSQQNRLQQEEREARERRERQAIATSLMLDHRRGEARARERQEDREFQRELYGVKSGAAKAAADAKLSNQTVPPTILNDLRERGVPFTEGMVEAGYSPETYRRLPPGDPNQMRGPAPDIADMRQVLELGGSPAANPSVHGGLRDDLGLDVGEAPTELPSIEPPADPMRADLGLPAAKPATPAPAAAPRGAKAVSTPKAALTPMEKGRTGRGATGPVTLTKPEQDAVGALDPESAAQWQRIMASGDAKKIALARQRLLEP